MAGTSVSLWRGGFNDGMALGAVQVTPRKLGEEGVLPDGKPCGVVQSSAPLIVFILA
jgi:hypothetical protein